MNCKDAFADPNMPIQRTTIGEHRIDINDETLFKEAVRRVPILNNEKC